MAPRPEAVLVVMILFLVCMSSDVVHVNYLINFLVCFWFEFITQQ